MQGLRNWFYKSANRQIILKPASIKENRQILVGIIHRLSLWGAYEDDFIVQKKYQDGAWVKIASVKTTTFTDNELIFNSLVFYRVCAHAGQYSSSYTEDSISAYLSPPSNFHITKISVTSVTLNWNINNYIEVGFKIERKKEGGSWEPVATITNPTYEDNNFELNTHIYYRVCTNVGNFNSTWVVNDFDATIPAPSNLQITNNSIISMTLTWQDNSIGEDGFKIERKYEGGVWEMISSSVNPNYVDTSFELNKTGYYRISAFAGQYNSSYVEKNFNSAIPAPSNLQITSNSINSVTLNWQYNFNGEEGFKIDRKKDGGSWEPLTTLSANILTFEDHTFELNTTIYYRVKAYVGQHNSLYAEKSFSSAIPAPSNLQITPNSINSVTLNWQYNYNGEEGFNVDRRVDGGNWEYLATLSANILTFEDHTFELNTTTYYRVNAFIGLFNSTYVEKSFDSSIPPPSNLLIIVNSSTSVTLKWDYSLTGHDGFKIDRKENQGAWVEEFAIVNANQTVFSDNVLDLSNNIIYYRVYTYFNQYNSLYTEGLATLKCGYSFTDNRDGNQYETVQIGNQCWMKENLAYLPNVSPSNNGSENYPYYFVFGYEGTNVSVAKSTANYQTYGVLYNRTASLNACPFGWHLPEDDAWTILIDYLGGSSVAGGKMKETGTLHWLSPNIGATNSSDFTGLPGGNQASNFGFLDQFYSGFWWASNNYYFNSLTSSNTTVYRDNTSWQFAFSIRCLQD